jgi:cytochrome c
MHSNLWILSIVAVVLTMVTAGAAGAAGNPDRGKMEFRRCASCHSAEPNVHKTGPSLAVIWRQKAGTVQGFVRYSEALKQSQVVWDRDTLDAWLRDPQGLIPGNRMTMRGIENARTRQDVVAYLEILASQNGRSSISQSDASGTSPRPKAPSDLPNLKLLAPEQQVQAIRHCGDTYFVTTAKGATIPFWEFNLRFKTDSSAKGPPKGRPVLVGSGMQGDRASLVFTAPAEISAFIEEKC